MSVLIKNMEIPTSCWACPFSERRDPDTDRCFITGRSYDATFARIEFRLDDCPLVPVPPHGRLIDADKLKEAFSKVWKDNDFYCTITAEVVDNAPTVIDAEGEK